MRRTQVLAMAVLTSFAATATACDTVDLFNIDLTGRWGATLNQVNVPTPHTVEGTGTGAANLVLVDGDLAIVVDIGDTVTSAVTGATINGPATASTDGPVVLDLTPRMTTVIGDSLNTGRIVNAVYDLESLIPEATGELRVSPQTLIDLFNNGTAYVQVNTVLNPNGELRGTIVPTDIDIIP